MYIQMRDPLQGQKPVLGSGTDVIGETIPQEVVETCPPPENKPDAGTEIGGGWISGTME